VLQGAFDSQNEAWVEQEELKEEFKKEMAERETDDMIHMNA
jgi:hypothetical protein